MGLRWLQNAKEINTKNMKCTCPTPAPTPEAQRHLYSTDWRRGLASGVTQILGLASGIGVRGNAKIYQHVGILALGDAEVLFFALGDAEILFFALGDAKIPDATYFAFWWNIGFNVYCE